MRVIVCGSRSWNDYGAIFNRLAELPAGTTVVHGKCPTGADDLADLAAFELGLPAEHHPADWDAHGRGAGFRRNEQMAALGAELCLAFWDTRSRGTAHMIARAQAHKIPVEVHTSMGVLAREGDNPR